MENNIQCPICIYNTGPLTPDQIARRHLLYVEQFPPEIFAIIEFDKILPNAYYITNYSRVFSIDGRALCPMYDYAHNDKSGNPSLRIELGCIDGKRRKYYINRLVANAFVYKSAYHIENGKDLVIHKINKNSLCNYAWNLEWGDEDDNVNNAKSPQLPFDQHLFDHSIITDQIDLILQNQPMTNRPTKITDWQADAICHAYIRLGYSPKDCAIYAGLEPTKNMMKIVHSILQGKSWHHISEKYGIPQVYHK